MVDSAQKDIGSWLVGEESDPPPLIYLFLYLDFVKATDTQRKLVATFKEWGMSHQDWVDWVAFAELLSQVEEPTHNLLQSVNQVYERTQALNRWLTEALKWLDLRLRVALGESGSLTAICSDISLQMFSDNWIRWRVRLMCTVQFYFQGKLEGFSQKIEVLETELREYGLEVGMAVIQNLKGSIIQNQEGGDVDQALELFTAGLENAERFHNIGATQSLYNNIGLLYSQLGNYDESIRYLEKALALEDSLYGEVLYHNNIAFTLFQKGELARSEEEYRKAQHCIDQLPEKTDVSGYVELGKGLHAAVTGSPTEALPHFNRALECFDQYQEMYGKIFLFGNTGRVFYENKELTLARQHFERFYTLLEETNTFSQYYSYYCSFVLLLLDLRDWDAVEDHLTTLQLIAVTNRNRLFKAWYEFVVANYQFEKFNLGLAEELFRSVLHATNKNGPFELALRSVISLSEVLLRRYTYSADPTYLTEIRELLEMAEQVGTNNPIYPTVIYVKLYKAMLETERSDYGAAEITLAEALELIEHSGLFTLKSKLLSMVENIKNQRMMPVDFATRFTEALQLGTGRQRVSLNHQLSEDQIGVIMWKFSNQGVDVVGYRTIPQLLDEDSVKLASTYLGTLFITLLGQGDHYHQGVFGPVPVGLPGKQANSLLSSKVLPDSGQTDMRLEGNYAITAVIYPAQLNLDRFLVQDFFEEWYHSIKDLNTFPEEAVSDLVPQLVAHINQQLGF